MLSALLFSVCANIDNLTVGTAYGIKKVKITFFSNLVIAAVSCIGTFFSMSFGKLICYFVPQIISNILGSLILILLGVWCIISPLFNRNKPSNINTKNDNINDQHSIVNYEEIFKNPERVDSDNSGNIDVKESFTLALALTINNLALGIGISITGLNIPLCIVLTFTVSILFIFVGQFLGKNCLSNFLGRYANLVSGIIIIALGIYNIVF